MTSVIIRDKSFGHTQILKEISFTVEPGETLAIVGPSGVGKTTLLRIVSGLDTKFEGTVDRPERLAMVFQEPTLLPWRTALDNICIASQVDTTKGVTALAAVGLDGYENRFPKQMSLGQQRRLALARAFASTPQLLLLDEPFVSLDPKTHEGMVQLTENLLAAHQVATLLVTHSKEESQRLATRVLTLGSSS